MSSNIKAFPARIDCHHHVFPTNLALAPKPNPKMGWKMPEENMPWSPELSLKAMEAMDVEMAILSYPPGVPSGDSKLIRNANIDLREICDKNPGKFGFFGCLGDLRNVKDVLEEIQYVFDTLKANGVNIVSSYGEEEEAVYVGDDIFDPIWKELDSRNATVFLHGSKVISSRPNPHPFLGVPIVEVPNETFKAASHLVVTGKKRRYPNIKFILSHFGGSVVSLAPRVAVLSHHMGSSLSPEEIIDDFKTFYYDTALSTHDHTLVAMKAFVGIDKIVFGTDFPAVSKGIANWYTKNADEFYQPEEKQMVMRSNLLNILSNIDTTV